MNKKRVLLGGEADFVSTGQDFFSNSEKFSVMVADDGDAMIAMLEEKPDLAIIDIDLPGRRGDDCCRIAKQSGLSPATLIALAVSTEKRQDIWRCIDAGCDVILPKPLQYERLAEVVTRVALQGGKAHSLPISGAAHSPLWDTPGRVDRELFRQPHHRGDISRNRESGAGRYSSSPGF